MKCRALIVPRHRGEATRRTLAESGWLRTDLAIRAEGDHLLLPLTDGAPPSPRDDSRVEEREFEAVSPAGPREYRDLLDWPEPLKDALPRSFDVIGDIVVIRLPPELEVRREEVGRALLRFVSGTRVVGSDHGVHGPERRRRVERIAGSGDFSTRHRENHLEFDVDLERAYFSPRLAREHAAVAEQVRHGDRVLDLCCGVGPFSVTIARDGRAERVTAVDSNPDAIALLRSTLARYPFGRVVTPVVSRVEEFLPSTEPVERVVLNLPHEGIKYLPLVGPAVRPHGRVYYYEVVPRTEVEERTEEVVSSLRPATGWKVTDSHVVHPYSPLSDLRAFTLERSGE